MHTPNVTPKDIARFWSKVDKRGPDECWPWLAGDDHQGYGRFRMPTCTVRAPRMAMRISRGSWPQHNACHTCDNPQCVNPAHLFDGTVADNTHDMIAKGRDVKPGPGELHHRAKLTTDQAQHLCAVVASGVSQHRAAKQFGISQSAVSLIVRGRTGYIISKEDGPVDDWDMVYVTGTITVGPDANGNYHDWPVYE